MKIDHDRKVITFRQSDLDTFGLCPERARIRWFEAEPDGNTDASVTGSGVHKGIEENLLCLVRGVGPLDTAEMILIAQREFDRIEREEGLRYVKGTYEDAMAFIEKMIPAWRTHIEPLVDLSGPLHLEEHFDVFLMYWGDWEVRLSGTPDCVDRIRPWDWKTAGQPYKQWEKQRWAVQPTVYAHAAVTLGWLDWPVQFSYAVMQKSKTKEIAAVVEVMRFPEHVDWLCRQINAILIMWAKLGEQGPWPLIDTHALCSEKWCPSWRQCKGASIPLNKFLWKP